MTGQRSVIEVFCPTSNNMKSPQSLSCSLRLPIVAAPMFLESGPELVLAACKARIVGVFPTPNARPISMLDDWMKQITEGMTRAHDEESTSAIGPWCGNLATHSSNTRLAEDLELIARYQPPIVVTALGCGSGFGRSQGGGKGGERCRPTRIRVHRRARALCCTRGLMHQ